MEQLYAKSGIVGVGLTALTPESVGLLRHVMGSLAAQALERPKRIALSVHEQGHEQFLSYEICGDMVGHRP